MPKKTREEKMAAQLRRMKEQLAMRQSSPISTPPPKPAVSPQPEAVATTGFSISKSDFKKTTALQPTKEVEQRYDYTYIAGDLRKIAALAAVAITLEIALNLTTRASFAKLILRSFGIEI